MPEGNKTALQLMLRQSLGSTPFIAIRCSAAGADSYSESVVALSSIAVGAVTAAFAVGLGDDSTELEAGIDQTSSVIAVLAGAGGYCVAATAFAIVEAAGKSTLVLYLEDPNALKRRVGVLEV